MGRIVQVALPGLGQAAERLRPAPVDARAHRPGEPGEPGETGLHRIHGEPERLQAPGKERDLGGEARPDRGQGRRRHDHRRENREAVSGPPGPGKDLYVRAAEGTRAVPGCRVQRPRRLSPFAGGHPRQRRGREVRAELGCADPETGIGDAGPAGTQCPEVPVVKGVRKTYHCGVEVQGKCPVKCSAKMSLG